MITLPDFVTIAFLDDNAEAASVFTRECEAPLEPDKALPATLETRDEDCFLAILVGRVFNSSNFLLIGTPDHSVNGSGFASDKRSLVKALSLLRRRRANTSWLRHCVFWRSSAIVAPCADASHKISHGPNCIAVPIWSASRATFSRVTTSRLPHGLRSFAQRPPGMN